MEHTTICENCKRTLGEHYFGICPVGNSKFKPPSIEALLSENIALRKALEEIANPIKFMQDQVAAEGGSLNGIMAMQLSNDPNYLKGIASKALSLIQPKTDQP